MKRKVRVEFKKSPGLVNATHTHPPTSIQNEMTITLEEKEHQINLTTETSSPYDVYLYTKSVYPSYHMLTVY